MLKLSVDSKGYGVKNPTFYVRLTTNVMNVFIIDSNFFFYRLIFVFFQKKNQIF